MTEEPNDPILIDDLVEELPDERKMVAFQRALRRYGIGFELTAEGGVEITDPEVDSLEELGETLDQDDFIELFEDELKRLVANDMLEELHRVRDVRRAPALRDQRRPLVDVSVVHAPDVVVRRAVRLDEGSGKDLGELRDRVRQGHQVRSVI